MSKRESLPVLHLETAVRDRYAHGAQELAADLCCPTNYDASLLAKLPQEIIDKDYGCGDPSKFVASGETVLDLGSGGGKICYIAAQIVGAAGRVIGVDFNDPMLALARKYQADMAQKLGYANVQFKKGKIQDLALDLEMLDAYLKQNPVKDVTGYLQLQAKAAELRHASPLVMDHSIDVVLSNCVLNLVQELDRRPLFSEIFRVLKAGGRAVISDIVSDEPVPDALRSDPDLWSGCISGAFTEDGFVAAFEDAGFEGVEIVARSEAPWRVVDGIEFRSVTVRAYKFSKEGELDCHQAAAYRGPWAVVMDERGNAFGRGQVVPISDQQFERFQQAPYAGQFTLLSPAIPVDPDEAEPFARSGHACEDGADCSHPEHNLDAVPAESIVARTKWQDRASEQAGGCCGGGQCD